VTTDDAFARWWAARRRQDEIRELSRIAFIAGYEMAVVDKLKRDATNTVKGSDVT